MKNISYSPVDKDNLKSLRRASVLGGRLMGSNPRLFRKILTKWENHSGREFRMILKNNHPEFFQSFVKANNSTRMNNRLMWHLMHPTQKPECPECGNPCSFFKKDYFKFCSNYCAMSSSSTKELRASNCMDKYGVSHIAHLESTKAKREQTLLERYGETNPQRVPSIRMKAEQTCIKRYGVRHPSQNALIQDKKRHTGLRYTEVSFKGKTILLQGYEPQVFDDLISTGKVVEIWGKNAEIPTIGYEQSFLQPYDVKHSHYYFPDFLIKTKKGIHYLVEVKSLYTLAHPAFFKSNLWKFRAARLHCQQYGWIFLLAVRHRDGKIDYFKDPSFRKLRKYVRKTTDYYGKK